MESKNYVLRYSGSSEEMSLEEFYGSFTNILLDNICDDIRNADFIVNHRIHICPYVEEICDRHLQKAYYLLQPAGFLDEEKWEEVRERVRLYKEDVCTSLEREFMLALINAL